MCDYSAKAVKQRAAVQNDSLISGPISGHTNGFTAVDDRSTAVCLQPGTELAFAEPVNYNKIHRLPSGAYTVSRETAGHKTARFRELNKGKLAFHDSLEFPDGTLVMVHQLVHGQVATVLQLPAQPVDVAEQMRGHDIVDMCESVLVTQPNGEQVWC